MFISPVLNEYVQHPVPTLLDCAYQCFPTYLATSNQKLVGWNDGTGTLTEADINSGTGCVGRGRVSLIRSFVYY